MYVIIIVLPIVVYIFKTIRILNYTEWIGAKFKYEKEIITVNERLFYYGQNSVFQKVNFTGINKLIDIKVGF